MTSVVKAVVGRRLKTDGRDHGNYRPLSPKRSLFKTEPLTVASAHVLLPLFSWEKIGETDDREREKSDLMLNWRQHAIQSSPSSKGIRQVQPCKTIEKIMVHTLLHVIAFLFVTRHTLKNWFERQHFPNLLGAPSLTHSSRKHGENWNVMVAAANLGTL